MDSTTTFNLFPTLPAELRLKIYSHAFPYRILQLGYDFPFPFLRIPPSDQPKTGYASPGEQGLHPVRVCLPALFHACHESRQLCLSTYIPFGYTYAHPRNDTLYISSYAAPVLSLNMNWYYSCARPPLYPLAELDRVAVEFDWLDLPLEGRETGRWLLVENDRLLYSSPLLENYLAAFAEFGMPKELLVVGRTAEARLQDWSRQLRGWKKIKFVEDPNVDEPRKSEAVLQYIQDSQYYQREDVSWFRGRLPDIKIVGAEKDGESSKPDWEDPELLILGDQVASEWQKKEWKVHGRDWDTSIDGFPYEKAHMENALGRAKAEEYISGQHHGPISNNRAPNLDG